MPNDEAEVIETVPSQCQADNRLTFEPNADTVDLGAGQRLDENKANASVPQYLGNVRDVALIQHVSADAPEASDQGVARVSRTIGGALRDLPNSIEPYVLDRRKLLVSCLLGRIS